MGLGFNDFTAGDVLTAAQVDGYLMRQSTMVFASTSARDTALSGNLEEGMHAYASDINTVHFYDGSAWVVVHEPPQTWSPTITQSGSVSGTVNRGWYQRSNGVFIAQLRWTATAAGTASNAIQVSTPVTMASAFDSGGGFVFYDSGSTTYYVGSVFNDTTTTVKLATSGETALFGVAPVVTIASSDSLLLTLTGRYA